MVDTNKILYLDNLFVKSADSADDDEGFILVEGYASTVDKDRHNDVVATTAWKKGLENYLKNPVILAYHDHTQPCGRMVGHKADSKGLWIKAKISSAAGAVYKLVKDGVLTAFSIGFRVKEADYDKTTDIFVIKELELHEISVVAVPANQNTLFNLSKSFDNVEEYDSFKLQFAPDSTQVKGLETPAEAESNNIDKEWIMTPEEIKQMMAEAAKTAAEEAAKSIREAAEREAAEKAAQAKAEAELEARIKAAVAAVTPTQTGADKLLAEVEKRLADERAESQKALQGLEAALKEKAAELEAIQKSRMQFAGDAGKMEYADKEKAVLLAKMAGKSLESTRLGQEMIQKFGAHVPSATWETEVSLTMENEVRRRLVVAPNLRAIAMQTNVMTIPVNPEAGVATWVQNAGFGTTASAGNNATHALKEITLNAYKVATNEYVAFEEEEDALLAIMPVIRDAMVRRVARAVDRAMLRGAGAGADPVKGLAEYDAASTVTMDISNGDKLTVARLRAMRRDLGAWGLDPAEMVYIVSTDGYYDLLDDADFQTMDKVGDRATFLTGQIGAVANSPVLVSAEFADKADGAVGAIAFAPMNFLVGNQRGLRIDTDDLVETQRRVMVASLRTGLTQVTTNNGAGVSTLRYVA